MRDLVLFAVLAWLVVAIPKRPYIGALAWVVFGVMYPHRLAYGAAHHFPFSQVIAILTLLGLFLTKDHRELKGGAAGVVLTIFFGWTLIANTFAFHPADAWAYVDRVFKVILMTFVLLLLIHTREQIIALVWCLVISIGFYGFKGGIFVLATGGSFMVLGPINSAMSGNNSLGTGTVIILPLIYFLLLVTKNRWVRLGLMIALPLCAISVLGSYSRGALLAVFATGILLWMRGRNKLLLGALAVAFVLVAIPFMPEHWTARMNTIKTYEEDLSAMQRIWAWETAYNIAVGRFPLAGGFEFQSMATSALYSPNPNFFHVAHSIYFQVLGSLGFIGLSLYLRFWVLAWRQGSWLRKRCRDHADIKWAFQLGSMAQCALLAFFVGGAFLDIAFWDLPFYLWASLVGAKYVVMKGANLTEPVATRSPARTAARALG